MPVCSLKNLLLSLLPQCLLLIPISTLADSTPTQYLDEDFANYPLLLIQNPRISEHNFCPTEDEITIQCFLLLAKMSTKELTNPDSKNFANLFIAISQSDSGSEQSTKETIETITNPSLRGIALTYLAQLHLREGNIESASEIMAKALTFSDLSPQAYINIWLNILIADLFAKLGKASDSQNLINQATQTLTLVQAHNTRAELLSLIAQTKLRNGQRADSQKTMKTAVMEAQKVRDPYLKSLVLSFLSRAYYQLGSIPSSISYQELAQKYAEDASAPSRMVALAFLSSVQAETDQTESAMQSLKKTIETLLLVQSPYHRALSFAFLSQTLFFAREKITQANN